MFLTRSEYDRGVNTFSPEGRLFQVALLSTWFMIWIVNHLKSETYSLQLFW